MAKLRSGKKYTWDGGSHEWIELDTKTKTTRRLPPGLGPWDMNG